MKIDATTPIDRLLTAYDWVNGPEAQDAARAELVRRSEMATKYEHLTRALAVNATFNLDVLLTGDNVQVGTCEDFDYVRDPESHDRTPEGIAAAIIKATDGRR